MKSKFSTLTAAITLLAALAFTVQLAAQEKQDHKHKHHHYQLIDLGTLGGPNSFIPFEGTKTTNRRGSVIVEADTAVPDPYAPYCFQPLYGACQVNHALMWSDGSTTDLGALPGVNSSYPVWINSHGSVTGFSENGLIEPDAKSIWSAIVAFAPRRGRAAAEVVQRSCNCARAECLHRTLRL